MREDDGLLLDDENLGTHQIDIEQLDCDTTCNKSKPQGGFFNKGKGQGNFADLNLSENEEDVRDDFEDEINDNEAHEISKGKSYAGGGNSELFGLSNMNKA